MKHISAFGGRLKISPWLIVVVVICMLWGNVGVIMAFFLALLIHECAHMITARAVGVEVCDLTVLPFGCAATLRGYEFSTPARQMLCAAAGPIANIFTASLMLTVPPPAYTQSWELFFSANLFLAALNLLPVLPLDGGRVLLAGLSSIAPGKKVARALHVCGICVGAIMLGTGVLGLLAGQINLTVAVMGGFIMGYSVYQIKNLPLKAYEWLHRKHGWLGAGKSAPVAQIAARHDTPIIEVLKNLENSKVNVILVMNNDMTIRGQVTETALVHGAAKLGGKAPVGKLC